MGNLFNKTASSDNDVPTPQIVALSENDIKIIKETWKIPSANVRKFGLIKIINKIVIDLLTLI
jgi:hypothetical protein